MLVKSPPPLLKSPPPSFWDLSNKGGGFLLDLVHIFSFFGPKARKFWRVLPGFAVENASETLQKHRFCIGKPWLGGFHFKIFAPAARSEPPTKSKKFIILQTRYFLFRIDWDIFPTTIVNSKISNQTGFVSTVGVQSFRDSISTFNMRACCISDIHRLTC